MADGDACSEKRIMEISREDMIGLCERGRVPQEKWRNRDSQGAQCQMGEAWALLCAGCDFEILHEKGGLDSNAETWWVQIKSKGFNYFEGYSPYDDDDDPADYLTSDHYYIPTAARLDRQSGQDWY